MYFNSSWKNLECAPPEPNMATLALVCAGFYIYIFSKRVSQNWKHFFHKKVLMPRIKKNVSMSVYINLFVSSADEGIIFLIDGFCSLNLTPFYSVSQPLKLKYRSESFTLKELWVSKFNSSKVSRKLAISYLAQSALLSIFCKSYLIYLNFLNTFPWKSTSARKFSYSYNPHLQFIDKYLIHIGKGLDSLLSNMITIS